MLVRGRPPGPGYFVTGSSHRSYGAFVHTSRRSRWRAGMTTPTSAWWSNLRISSATTRTTYHLRAGCGLNPIFGGLL